MQTEDYEYLYALEESFWWFAGMREITRVLLDPLCPMDEDRLILDAGCGTGGNLAWLRRYARNGQVYGIDVSKDALRFCRARGHQLLACASVTALPFDNAHFDLVTLFDVLVQIPGAGSDEIAAQEVYRVLRPGGIAFVRVAAYEWLRSGHDEALATQRRYALSSISTLLNRVGFRVLRTTYANGVLLPFAAFHRLILKRIGLANSGSDVKPLTPSLGWLNTTLRSVLQTEAQLLRSQRFDLPAGVSAICIVKRPDNK
jgi:SAM-dependent methyltransferase